MAVIRQVSAVPQSEPLFPITSPWYADVGKKKSGIPMIFADLRLLHFGAGSDVTL